MLTDITSWFGGFVVLKVAGTGQERFLNLALQRGIEIWDTNWLSPDVLELKAARQNVRELRRIAALCGCKLLAGGGWGLPFALRYLLGRKSFAVGVVLFAAGLIMLSQLVFAVNVLPQEQLTTLDTAKVAALAQELGVKPGALYRRLDIDEICRELKAQIPEISWVYIERSGTVVNIKVAERSVYPETLENATLGAIWADRDALIEDVLLKHGQAVAKHGDTVKVGDLLVSPMADGRADAIIYARVWYSGYAEVPLGTELQEPAGRAAVVYMLAKDDGARLLLWGSTPKAAPGQQVAQSSATYRLGLWGVPFCLQCNTLQLMNVTPQTLSEAEAKRAAYLAALKTVYAQQSAHSELLNERVDYELLDGGVWACEVEWECREVIGTHNR